MKLHKLKLILRHSTTHIIILYNKFHLFCVILYIPVSFIRHSEAVEKLSLKT